MNNTIPFLDLSREIDEHKDEIMDSINTVVKNTNFILGKELNQFETNFANFIGTNYCVGVGNGTDAIEMAIKSLGLKDDDEVLTQANTYVATCLAVTNNNVQLKLVDIDPETYQIDLDELEKQITPKTKVIIVVHLTGSCCDMTRLQDIIDRHGIILIEDCAQSHGAYYADKKLGTYGIISTFSFYPGKNLGAFGDGGAICTSYDNIYNKLMKMRNNGSIEKYVHETEGRNSRLDTIQASILDVKLKYLNDNNQKRRENAKLYYELLKNIQDIELPIIKEKCVPVYHLFMIRTKYRDELQHYLKENGISTDIHYPISIPYLVCYENYFEGIYQNKYKNALSNSKLILSLPMFPNLSEKEIKTICSKIETFFIEKIPF